ncbi:MAG: response regulator [Pseudomonadota bacterium]
MTVVMLVEDSQEDRYFARRILRKLDESCEVIEFEYVDDALSHLRTPGRKPIDLIIADINMPKLTGFDFVDAFGNLYSELKGAARVFLASHSINPRDRDRAEAHPVVEGYLEKPLRRDQLATILALDA